MGSSQHKGYQQNQYQQNQQPSAKANIRTRARKDPVHSTKGKASQQSAGRSHVKSVLVESSSISAWCN
eukprot:3917715-Amphidinium_carterae.4